MPARPFWREIEFWLLAILATATFGSRLTALSVRGEESRWAQVAREMQSHGDYVVPRQQTLPFPDRPPLNSWCMLLAARITGDVDLLAVRLPAALATIATALLVYGYARNFLSPVGALAAGAALATMAQVIQLGRQGESDGLLMFFVSASLLGWHAGYMRRWNPWIMWTLGYVAAAMAGLVKGPQGPIYFMSVVPAYLIFVERDWRSLFRLAHVAGLAAMLAVIAAWLVPFYLATDLASAEAVWSEGGGFSDRLHYGTLTALARQLTGYPLEVLAAMLPWSFMLLPYASRWMRGEIGTARPYVRFLVTACAVTFPTCWLTADSRSRYFMSLYPCVAVLVGLAIERSLAADQLSFWKRSWPRLLRLGAPWMALCGLLAIASTRWPVLHGAVRPTLAAAVAFAVAAAAIAALAWCASGKRTLAWNRLGVLALGGFAGLVYVLPGTDALRRSSTTSCDDVAALKRQLRADDRLVSFGPVHHQFAFYYHDPLPLCSWPSASVAAPSGATYFCYQENASRTLQRPFDDWETVAVISCDRCRREEPVDRVVVGRHRRQDDVKVARQSKTPNEALANDQGAPPGGPHLRNDLR